MSPPPRMETDGLGLGPRTLPQIKELTITLGDADLYIHMERRVELGNGHSLYEAVLTDSHGSRAIYVDHEDVVACLEETFRAAEPASGTHARDLPQTQPGARGLTHDEG